MSVEFCRGSPGKFDSRTLSRKTLSRWTGRNNTDNGKSNVINNNNNSNNTSRNNDSSNNNNSI